MNMCHTLQPNIREYTAFEADMTHSCKYPSYVKNSLKWGKKKSMQIVQHYEKK